MTRFFITFLLIILISQLSAQGIRNKVNQGNSYYHEEKYEDALSSYQDALLDDPLNEKVLFNQGNALYKMGKYEESVENFQKILGSQNIPFTAKTYYNIGNAYFQQNKLQESIDAYKRSLELNPDDYDTKYNLELARAKLKENAEKQPQQQQQNQQNQQQNQQQQSNEDQQDQENQEQEQNEEQQENQEQQEQQAAESEEQQTNEESESPEEEEKMDKEEAERILNALQDEELEAQENKPPVRGGKKTGWEGLVVMVTLCLSRLCMLILLMLAYHGYAQEVSLRAFVSSNNVSLDTQFQYSVEISGSTTKMPEVNYPDFKDFFVISGPNTSTSIQWVNGNMTSTQTYSFYLKPKKEGKLNIGEASLEIKGKTYRSSSITINVSKGSGAVSPRNNKQGKTKTSKDSEISGDNLYLKTLVSDRDIYLGEQIIVEYKLYFKVNVRGYDFEKLPSSPGFWAEEIEMPGQPVIDNEIINGINYNVATLKKYALFPTQAGKLVIEPLNVTLEALVRSKRRRSVFDSFFDDPFGSTVQKKIASKAVEIKVNDLPANNQPIDFNGAVGKYKLAVTLDKNTAKVNEAFSLKIKISGTGNIKLLELPTPQIPPDIEKYDPKFTSNVNVKTALVNGSKQAEYILIPRLPGKFNIKPVSFSYFDPVAKAYKTLSSTPIDIDITGEVPKLAGTQIQYSRQEVALLGEDIRFIKESSRFAEAGKRSYQSGFFWMSLVSCVALFSGFVVYNDYAAKISGDKRLSRSKQAGRIATRQLKEAKHHLSSESSAEFYKAISQALRGFVQDKLNLEISEFNTPGARKKLMDVGIDSETIDEYIIILEESDFRQFANSSSSEIEKQDTYNKTKKLLIKLEKWI